jgi:two-component system, cell cycle response regulator
VKILIADDDPVSRRVLEAHLVAAGHEVIGVSDGLEAMRVSALPDSPRMVIVDWMMPGADGLAVCQAIRQSAGPYKYVILLTSRDSQEDMLVALAAEADDFIKKPCNPVELLARLRSGERVLNLQQRLLDAQAELLHQATHDRLTGLPNRAMALDRLERELDRAKRERQPLALGIADIDRFKCVNDAHGHLAGDEVLRQTAARMNAVRRPYDFIARYGGEEFLLFFPGSDMSAAAAMAERVRHAVAVDCIHVGALVLPVTISMGVACTLDAGEDPAGLIHAADSALYRAKANGRDRVER